MIKVINVELNNQQQELSITEELGTLLRKVVQTTCQIEGYDSVDVSIAFVDNKRIKILNEKYRNISEATDVLSFPMDDEILGDIIISVERASEQAKEYGHSFAREMAYLTVHGTFHLLGYDHYGEEEKELMRRKEERVLGELDITRR